MTTLNTVAIGGTCVVESISGDDDITIRLMEMGIIPGTELKVIGVAPLGDPVELELRGYRLSIRRAEAERIEVKFEV